MSARKLHNASHKAKRAKAERQFLELAWQVYVLEALDAGATQGHAAAYAYKMTRGGQ